MEGPVAATAPPTAAARTGRTAWRSTLFWCAAIAILVLDLWSKQRVFEWLGVDPSKYSTMEQFWNEAPRRKEFIAGEWLRFVTMLNPGMMWGAFQEHPEVLRVLRPLAVLVIFFLLSSMPARQWGSRLALGAILGGAVGNIWDSFRYLGVRDFIEVNLPGVPLCEPFPSFNVADAAICVGVAVLALGMMRGEKRDATETPKAA